MTEAMTEAWPALAEDWADARDTLHLWTQVAGKVRMALTPPVNHWWHVPLYVSARGLTTGTIPYGERGFELLFDFIDHRLRVLCSDASVAEVPLRPQTTAAFYAAVMEALRSIGVEARISPRPSEIADALPFDRDQTHAAYDPDAAARFWRVLLQATRVFAEFRTGFLGKASPIHFFWGSFDLAMTFFSGRRAPAHPGTPLLPDHVTAEAYSHEVWSAGFWPGAAGFEPVFYAYAYPAPDRFAAAAVGPAAARFEPALGEFVLPYGAMRADADPDAALLAFLHSSYVAAAELGGWPRGALERRTL